MQDRKGFFISSVFDTVSKCEDLLCTSCKCQSEVLQCVLKGDALPCEGKRTWL